MLTRRTCILYTTALAAFDSPALADGAHAAFTIIEYNSKAARLEVIHRIVALDMEVALTARKGNIVRLDAGAEVEPLIESYLRDYFRILIDDVEPLPLQWVGHELFAPTVFAYQEAPWPESALSLSIFNHVLTDAHPTQVNTVNVTIAGKTQTRIFTQDDGFQKVALS